MGEGHTVHRVALLLNITERHLCIEGGYDLRDGIVFDLFISTAPCGDSRNDPIIKLTFF